jgi:hypothetical protein
MRRRGGAWSRSSHRGRRATAGRVERDDLFRKVADEVVNEMIAHREELARRHGRGSGKVNTVAVHISAIRNRLTPAFGDIPIPDLDGETVNTWAREFEVIARRGPEKGRLVPLSKQQARHLAEGVAVPQGAGEPDLHLPRDGDAA